MIPRLGEHVLMKCTDKACPYVRIIIGPNSRQDKGWSLGKVKCLRCESPMTLSTLGGSGIDMYRNVVTRITADSILARSVLHDYEEKKIEEYWRMSKIWKAIHDEIDKADIEQSLFTEKRHHINHTRASSGINLERVYVFCAGANNSYDEVRFCYKVCFRDDDEDARRPVYTRSEMVDVPSSLVVNFTKDDFDNFRETRRETMEKRHRETRLHYVKDLLESFPDLEDDLSALVEKLS